MSRSQLSCQLEAANRDLDWMLAHFTFVADATTLADECDIICSPALSVANCHTLPFVALSFLGESPELLASYATFLVEPGTEVTLLLNNEQRVIAEEAFEVLEVIPEWQMVFEGAAESLDTDGVISLQPRHLPAMQALAEASGLTALGEDVFLHGPAFGIWAGNHLVSMGSTRLRIPGAAEIGNIATHPDHRGRGYAGRVVGALVKALSAEDLTVFLMVYQRNTEAIRLYERLDFMRRRPMYLMRCRVEEDEDEALGKSLT